MKKLFALLMAAMMLLCCVACGGRSSTKTPAAAFLIYLPGNKSEPALFHAVPLL